MNTRTKKSLGAVALLAAAGALLSPSSAGAYNVTGSKWNARSLPIRYYVNASTAPSSLGSSAALAAVQGGFASWQAPACTSWRSMYAGPSSVTLADQSDGENSVLWVASGWNADPRNNPMGDVRGTIGVTQTTRIVGGATNESDISFNAQGFRWSTTGTGGTVDAQSIATHEEGHFLGLDHSSDMSAVMYASYSSGLKRTLQGDDIAGVCALYPSGVTTPDAGVDSGPRDTGTADTGSSGGGIGASCVGSGRCTGDNDCLCTDRTLTNCICLPPCESSADCPDGYLCADTSAGGYCVPDPSGGMTMTPGTGNTGDPCAAGSECRSSICVQVRTDSAVCTQACTNDCSCPTGYRCAMTTSGTNVCAPGTNTCSTGPVDAGTRDTGVRDTGARDTGTPTEDDAGTGEDASANMDVAHTETGTGTGGASPGCACAVPGAGLERRSGRSLWVAPWALLALAGAVRSRRKKG